MADLWASENPPTTEAPRPNPWMVIPMMMVTKVFLKGKYLKGPAMRVDIMLAPAPRCCPTENKETGGDENCSNDLHEFWRISGQCGVTEIAPERQAEAVGPSDHHEECAHLEGGERRLEVVKVGLQRGLKEAKAGSCRAHFEESDQDGGFAQGVSHARLH